MVEFICLFFPPVIAVGIFEGLAKKRFSKRNIVYLYALYTVIINFISFFLKRFLLRTGDMLLTKGGDMIVSAAVNYLIIVFPLSIIVGLISALIYKRFDIHIE